MNLWMAYTCNVKGLEEVERMGRRWNSAAKKYDSSAGHHEQKNQKTTGQMKFSAVLIKQRVKLVL